MSQFRTNIDQSKTKQSAPVRGILATFTLIAIALYIAFIGGTKSLAASKDDTKVINAENANAAQFEARITELERKVKEHEKFEEYQAEINKNSVEWMKTQEFINHEVYNK